jgi:integrase
MVEVRPLLPNNRSSPTPRAGALRLVQYQHDCDCDYGGFATTPVPSIRTGPTDAIKVGFKRAVVLSGVAGQGTPHTLRHTAATWLMQSGISVWEAAGFLGMSPAMVEQIYGHHHPAYMRGATEALRGRVERRQGWLPKP